MRTRLLFASLFLLAVARPARAQTYGVDKCRPSSAGIGAVVATGRVRYTLGGDGTPDTASLGVLAVDRISPAGYHSVVARLLSGCKMHHPDAALAVVQMVRFDTGGAHLTPAAAAAADDVPLPLQPTPPAVTGPVDASDSTLEEHPSWITCDRPPRTQPPTTTGRGTAAEQNMFAAASPMNSGMVTARLLIGADGRVMKDSLTLVSSDNPQNTSNLLRALASCRYAPGRIGGTPVATRLTATIIVGSAGYSVVALPGRSVPSRQ